MDANTVVFNLMLESAIAIHYQGKRQDSRRGNIIGGFFFPDFPIVSNDGNFTTADLLQIEVDLKKRRMVSAKLDDEQLSAREVITLLVFYIVSAFHVKIHAMANWAINMENEQMKSNPFIGRDSVVTTLYNYFGVTFCEFVPVMKAVGLLGKAWEGLTFNKCASHGLKENVFCHPLVHELAPYSEFVNFHCKLRPFFLKEFSKVKSKYFPGIDGQALYIGKNNNSTRVL